VIELSALAVWCHVQTRRQKCCFTQTDRSAGMSMLKGRHAADMLIPAGHAFWEVALTAGGSEHGT